MYGYVIELIGLRLFLEFREIRTLYVLRYYLQNYNLYIIKY